MSEVNGLGGPEFLKRFLYLSNHYVFMKGNPEPHLDNCQNEDIFKWAKTDLDNFLYLLALANNDPLLVRRCNIFFILAKALQSVSFEADQKLQIKNNILKFVKSDEDFLDFIKYFSLGRSGKQKISNSVKKLVFTYYSNKSSRDWLETLSHQQSYHGWSHKDLIKLCHFKPSKEEIVPIVNFILFGIKKLPENSSDPVITLKKIHKLKTTKDEVEAATLIKELKAPICQINTELLNSDEVWAAAVSVMPLRNLLHNLPRIYNLKLLKPNTKTFAQVNEILSKRNNANIHPVEWYIYRKLFQRRGKELDRKLVDHLVEKEVNPSTLDRLTSPKDVKCKDIIQKLTTCLNNSYKSTTPCDKKILITIDTSQTIDNSGPYKKKINVYEAIYSITQFLLRIERNVTTAVFKDTKIEVINLKKMSMGKGIKELRKNTTEYIKPVAPILWAEENKKCIDIFINFMDKKCTEKLPAGTSPDDVGEAFIKYKTEHKLPDARLILIYLGDGGTQHLAYSKYQNVLVMNGFSAEVPRILEAFCKGKFC